MIRIRGACEHNLKNLDLEIGPGLTAVTGVSGSGKTSLVFDTLYHEARRRLYDVLAIGRPGGWRNQLMPARVESIQGLGPAIAVEQNILNRNPNSTLATACGLHPFLRLLFTHYGQRHCAHCGQVLEVLSEDEVVELLVDLAGKHPLRVYAPLLRGVFGSHRTLISLLEDVFGRQRLRIDGGEWQQQALDPDQDHEIEIELGTLDQSTRTAEGRLVVQAAMQLGARAVVARWDGGVRLLSWANQCAACGNWFEVLEPKHFHMSCPYCQGSGCERCNGTGAYPGSNHVYWQGLCMPELLSLNVIQVSGLFAQTYLPANAQRLHQEIERRLDALTQVGLGYLELDRSSPTLSRGESQRVRLAVALSSRLGDLLYVLDEPTIGQHPADVVRTLPAFRKLGGQVVFIEHDRMAAAQAEHVIDLGPGAGAHGGELVFEGSPLDLWGADTPTGRYFSLGERVVTPPVRPPAQDFLCIEGARVHNLANIDVHIPVGRLTAVTGVSGSGKSTLVEHVLVESLKSRAASGCARISGPRLKPVLVDQEPIGRNPRSNPATYTKLADILREFYARETGLSASHFSFNRPEGACPTCSGMGAVEVKMQYLSSVWIPCEDCEGQRFNEQVLASRVDFNGHRLSIAELYQLSIMEVYELIGSESRLTARSLNAARRILEALTDVGLGYLTLGQPSPTLSGGEAQRVKLSKFLGRGNLQGGLLVLDEPSTGLHPHDLSGLLLVLDRLVRGGATVVVVEHNTDIIRAADWIIDLGPGAGPDGGRLLYCGPREGLPGVEASPTAQALRQEQEIRPREGAERLCAELSDSIRIRNARAHNLKGVDVDIPKGKLSVVTGVSGSGKSSLVNDVLEAEAQRRYLETLSLYERQGVREGPEAPVDSIAGLGVTLAVGGLQAHRWSALTHFTRRASVGRATELNHHIAILLAEWGERICQVCGSCMVRGEQWICECCGALAEIARPRQFSTFNYASACERCSGVGVIFEPQPEKLIVYPERALCNGAMYSPGYWPETYLCKDTGIVQALAERYGFDPEKTPWNEMPEQARQAFLFGDEQPLERTYRSKSTGKLVTSTDRWEGFYGGWVRDWDVHGTYTRSVSCPDCGGAGLKADYLVVTLAGHNLHQLSELPLDALRNTLDQLPIPEPALPAYVKLSLETALRRLRFLCQVGLGYLNLNRPSGTLSAGEAQRIQLAGLLGSELTSLTILLDEPSRGMHPVELEALYGALAELRDQGNTVIVVEHDLQLIRMADHVIDLGPAAGAGGGSIVAQGTPQQVARSGSLTGKWLRADFLGESHTFPGVEIEDANPRAYASSALERWMVIRGARCHNLKDLDVEIPLGRLVGACGVSGSGKSSLLIDTLGRALVNHTHTTSFASEPLEAGEHDSIEGAPVRAQLVDQSRRDIRSPAVFLGLTKHLLKLYATSPDALAAGLDESHLGTACKACKGRGTRRQEMGFLPDIYTECETCQGTGFSSEAWNVKIDGISLPEVNSLTLDQVCELFSSKEILVRPLRIAHQVGLGYLVWRQPGYSLSGGEAQRLKIVRELSKRSVKETLYIFDEPTVGLHMEDISLLIATLHRLVGAGHTVLLVEHHPQVLAACDWLIELGPGGGPLGGELIAAGPPAQLARLSTPTAPYLRQVLGLGVGEGSG